VKNVPDFVSLAVFCAVTREQFLVRRLPVVEAQIRALRYALSGCFVQFLREDGRPLRSARSGVSDSRIREAFFS
jgi:hypothetical protein